jgi:hypothetical protein
MAADTTYESIEFIFRSKGVVARPIVDRAPENTYLNLDGALEREEESLSSTYGTVIINRTAGSPGLNFFLPNPIVTLSRLYSAQTGNAYRYAGDDHGILYRRATDTQGPYLAIANGLSGKRWSSVVNTTYGSSTPYLFIADAALMLKDSGTGGPTRIGILPPNDIANTTPFAAQILPIDFFQAPLGSYAITQVTGWSSIPIGTVVSGGAAMAVNNFISFGVATGITYAFNGAIAAVLGNSGTAPYAQLFDVYATPQVPQLAGYGLYGSLTNVGATIFLLNSYGGNVAQNVTASVGKTVALDLSQNNQVTDDDLIVLTLQVSNPQNIQQVNVNFDIANSNYSSSYYTKSISPVYYQSGITGTATPYATLANQVYATSLQAPPPSSSNPALDWLRTALGGQPSNSASAVIGPSGGQVQKLQPTTGAASPQLTPATLATGPDGWIAIYMRRGDFLPVGQAGENNKTWANVTGWQIEIITTAYGGQITFPWSYPGKPPAGTNFNVAGPFPYDIDFPANFGGSTGTVGTPPTSGFPNYATFGIGPLYGTPFGVVRIYPDGSFHFDTSGLAVTLHAGEIFSVYTPNPQDATLADVSLIFAGTIAGQAGSDFAFNGLYLQWGAGPSSFAGVGYDYRYTYYNINTGTESNGSQIEYSSQQFGTASSLAPLIVLRQAINVSGTYSTDPQTTHVRVYRRGGILPDNWQMVDQIPNITGFGAFIYKDIIPDSSLLQASTLALDNDVPITSSLPNPISTTLSAPVGGSGPNVYDLFGAGPITVADPTANFLLNQILVIGTPQNLEQVPVSIPGTGTCDVTLRLKHAAGEPVLAFSIPAQAVDLVELAYGQLWWAGDPNNPHYLYYSKPGYPENAGPQNYIAVSQPSDPITVVANFRGTLFVSTLTTWYQIIGGANPYAQPTGSKHGCVAKHGYTKTESAIFFEAIDGIREFRGADAAYRSLPIEWLYRNNHLTPIPLVDLNNLSYVTMAYWNNFVYISYPTPQ